MARRIWHSQREPRIRTFGQWYGMGPQVKDQVSGIPIPEVLTVPQRGGRVYHRFSDGTRDKPDWDEYRRYFRPGRSPGKP